jgi:hypothetical protein
LFLTMILVGVRGILPVTKSLYPNHNVLVPVAGNLLHLDGAGELILQHNVTEGVADDLVKILVINFGPSGLPEMARNLIRQIF